jgi:hypothetical protein
MFTAEAGCSGQKKSLQTKQSSARAGVDQKSAASMTAAQVPWALLKSLNPVFPDYDVVGNHFNIGRHHGCQIRIPSQHISSIHCRIIKPAGEEDAQILDLSTNGTYLILENGAGELVGKSQAKALRVGARFSLVVVPSQRADRSWGYDRDPNMNDSFVAYEFQAIAAASAQPTIAVPEKEDLPSDAGQPDVPMTPHSSGVERVRSMVKVPAEGGEEGLNRDFEVKCEEVLGEGALRHHSAARLLADEGADCEGRDRRLREGVFCGAPHDGD